MRLTHRITVAALGTGLILGLAACSPTPTDTAGAQPTVTQSASTGADASEHNAADTEFAQMMIVHHQGAIEMAELAVAKASTDEVRSLGERIAAAQGPEIDVMSGWLDSWGQPQPADAEMAAMGHEGMDMGGLDQAQVMAELSGLSGTEFDKRFLELMIEHHQGAITMAETTRAAALNAEVVVFVGKVIDDQTSEITEMRNLLRAL